MTLQQSFRTWQSPFIYFGVATRAQDDKVGQFVGSNVIAVKCPPFDNVMNGNALLSSAYLAFVTIAFQRFAALCPPIRAARKIEWLRSSLPIAVFTPLPKNAKRFALTFFAAIAADSFGRKEASDRVIVPADFTLFSYLTFRNERAAAARTILSISISPCLKFFTTSFAYSCFALHRIARSVLISTTQRTVLFFAASLYINRLSAEFAVANLAAFLRLVSAFIRAIYAIRMFWIGELFTALWTRVNEGAHSVFTSHYLPDVMSASGGKNRFSGATLADLLIIPQEAH